MITLIDYGYTNYYRLQFGQSTGQYKIDELEINLKDHPSYIIIDQIPQQIFRKGLSKQELSHYKSTTSDLNTCTINEYKEKEQSYLRNRKYDDDLNRYIFETVEDKNNYETFLSEWKPVLVTIEGLWEPVEFKKVYKQKIDEKYQNYISSEIIIPVKGYWDKEVKPVESLCKYSPNSSLMIRQIATSFGFTEVESNTFKSNTKGKKFSIHNGLEFSKMNDIYFGKDVSSGNNFKSKTGSYEECIQAFEQDYNGIYSYISMVAAEFSNEKMDEISVLEVYTKLKMMYRYFNEISVSKSNYDKYNNGMRTLKTLIERIYITKAVKNENTN